VISTSVAAEILDVLVIPQSGAFGSGRTGQSHSGVAPRQAPRSYSMLNAFPDALAAACGMWICGYEMCNVMTHKLRTHVNHALAEVACCRLEREDTDTEVVVLRHQCPRVNNKHQSGWGEGRSLAAQ